MQSRAERYSDGPDGDSRGEGTRNHIRGDPNVNLTMLVAVKKEWASAIIGRGGEVIKRLRRQCRCSIQVNDVAKH